MSKPGQPEDGRPVKKQKKKKPRKQTEKKNAPSVKQVASNTSKLTAGQKAAPQASKSSPQGGTQNKKENLATGENFSFAMAWPELAAFLVSHKSSLESLN